MQEIIDEFQSESKDLLGQLKEILEAIEYDHSQAERLADYGQFVDRIMGAAKSIELVLPPDLAEYLGMIGKYCELCKVVSYKSTQVKQNEMLLSVVVALLMDATEMLEKMVLGLSSESDKADIKGYLTQTFLDRLQWCNQQFGQGLRGTLGTGMVAPQSEIDALLKSLGVG